MTDLATPDGTPLSPLAFGTMQFGGKADAQASAAMYAMCREAGITHFDTAHVYTGGASEKILGQLVVHEREAVFIASKVAYDHPATAELLTERVDASRLRLGIDTIDLLYLHRWDSATDLRITFEALAGLQAKGAIRHIGVSNYAAWQVMKAQAVAASLGTRIDAIQPMYNLVKRQAEVELLPMARDQGIAVFPYSPLGGGLLTGKYAQGGRGRLTEDDRYAARYASDWMQDTARALAERAGAAGIAPETLAVAWAARHPAVTAPIISASDPAQLGVSLAGAAPLDDATYAALSALSPTPPPATDRSDEA
ncbi:aldo/keto reductase [Pseudaestuariivita atlantica]|uniref:Aldo/keto reductase n=1 Tax=Pseudaestuariivita atlantica TaxID=1317121 RepID=A0A0L1JT11_9RHOB|nr:aldo/keto reductase [Pseudaestuariivita atlantica]KNG94914.1 aldo/keto reductase [Pseudaestuariivita atlantica]